MGQEKKNFVPNALRWTLIFLVSKQPSLNIGFSKRGGSILTKFNEQSVFFCLSTSLPDSLYDDFRHWQKLPPYMTTPRVRFKGFYSKLAFYHVSSQWSLLFWLLRNFSSSCFICEIKTIAPCLPGLWWGLHKKRSKASQHEDWHRTSYKALPAQPLTASSLNPVQTQGAPSSSLSPSPLYTVLFYHSSFPLIFLHELSALLTVCTFIFETVFFTTVSTCSKTLCTIYPIQTYHSPYTSLKNFHPPGKIKMNKLKLNTLFICSVLSFPNLIILSGYGWQTSTVCGVLKTTYIHPTVPNSSQVSLCSLCVKGINLSLSFRMCL